MLVLLGCIIVLLPFVRVSNYPATNACINNLRQIDAAKEQWELEQSKTTNAVPSWEDLRPYFPKDMPDSRAWRNGQPICPEGGTYTMSRTGQLATCTIRYHTLDFHQMR